MCAISPRPPTASRPCSASTTPARCSTNSAMRCMACSPTSPIREFPAPASPPISSSCRRSSTSIGWSSREVLRRFALHYQTGEPMPEDLLQRLIAARNFNKGFATVEYVASAIVDLDFHSLLRRRRHRLHCVREESAVAHRHARRDRHAAPAAAFRPRLLRRRLCGGLLQLHVVGSARCRRLRGVRGDRRHFRSRHRQAAARHDLLRRRLARSGRRLQGVPRPAAERRRAVAQARLCRSPPPRPQAAGDCKHGRPAQRRPSPRRRLRAACGRGRSRPRHPRRGRQRDRSHGGHGGDHRRGLSAHEPSRRRRLLAHSRAVRPRARHHGGRPRRPKRAAGALSRLRSHSAARAARRAHRAGRGRRLDAGAGSREGARRHACRSMCC